MTDKNLDLIWDVNVQVYVRLGKTSLPMREIVSLEPGAIVQLDEKADAPVELFVNNKLVGYGEVVTIEDQLGIRIKEMVSNEDKK